MTMIITMIKWWLTEVAANHQRPHHYHKLHHHHNHQRWQSSTSSSPSSSWSSDGWGGSQSSKTIIITIIIRVAIILIILTIITMIKWWLTEVAAKKLVRDSPCRGCQSFGGGSGRVPANTQNMIFIVTMIWIVYYLSNHQTSIITIPQGFPTKPKKIMINIFIMIHPHFPHNVGSHYHHNEIYS